MEKKPSETLGDQLRHVTKQQRRQQEAAFVKKLQTLTKQQQVTKFKRHDPKALLNHRLHTALSKVFLNPSLLEQEAKLGKTEIIILHFTPVLEEDDFIHLSMEELLSLVKEILPLHETRCSKKGFRLILYALWFQNYLALSWQISNVK